MEIWFWLQKEGDFDGVLSEEDMEPSKLMSKMVKGFGKFVGFHITYSKNQYITFFQQLERA